MDVGFCVDGVRQSVTWTSIDLSATFTLPHPGVWVDLGDLNKLIVAAQRGEDTLLPGGPGVLPHLRRETVTVHTLRLDICGGQLSDGTFPTDEEVGLITNLRELAAACEPTYIGDGTVALDVIHADEITSVADAHLALEIGDMPVEGIPYQTAVLQVSIPMGKVVEE